MFVALQSYLSDKWNTRVSDTGAESNSVMDSELAHSRVSFFAPGGELDRWFSGNEIGM
jgi:hypothetical protein